MMSLLGNIVKRVFTASVNEKTEGLAVLKCSFLNVFKTKLNNARMQDQVEKNKD